MSTFSKWLFQEFFKLRKIYRDSLLASLLINIFALVSPLFVMNVYDRVVPNQAFETLWVLSSGVIIILLFDLTTKFLRHSFIDRSAAQLDSVLSKKLFERMLATRMDCITGSIGGMASQLKEFDSIKQFFTASTMVALIDLPFAALFLFIIFYIGGAVAIAPLIAMLVLVFYGLLMHFPLKKLSIKLQSAAAEKNAIAVESLSTLETIKAFNAQARQLSLWDKSLMSMIDLSLKSRRYADSIGLVSTFIIQLTVVAVLILGVYQINVQNMSLGALIACVLLSSRALSPMVQLASLISQFHQAKAALLSLDQLSSQAVDVELDRSYLNTEECLGKIELRNLSYTIDQRSILSCLSVTIQTGEKVALIGKIGAGKSTLLKLLMGFVKPTEGQVLVDDIDLQHLDISKLRAHIAYVPQEISLFRGSLRENILLKKPSASVEELTTAIHIAGLDDFVQSHPMGVDMLIGEQGKGLSGGQKQSVAIARSMINEPSIFLFDELSAAMDNQTEQEVIQNIKALSEGNTLLLSTHRSSLLSLVDRIIVMDGGNIVADGPKEKVMDALKRGLIKMSGPEEKK
ncbi:MAG: ATP-binding cassette subfamily C protein LapB [Oleiphilaceae bacterium]